MYIYSFPAYLSFYFLRASEFHIDTPLIFDVVEDHLSNQTSKSVFHRYTPKMKSLLFSFE